MSCGYCHAHCAHFLGFLSFLRERDSSSERERNQAFFARIVALGLLGPVVYVPEDTSLRSTHCANIAHKSLLSYSKRFE